MRLPTIGEVGNTILPSFQIGMIGGGFQGVRTMLTNSVMSWPDMLVATNLENLVVPLSLKLPDSLRTSEITGSAGTATRAADLTSIWEQSLERAMLRPDELVSALATESDNHE